MLKKLTPSYPMTILLSVILGSLCGVVLGEEATLLGDISLLFIQLLKALATPLVFLAIVDAFCKTKIELKSGVQMLIISAFNALVAGLIAVGLSYILPVPNSVQLMQFTQKGTPPGSEVPFPVDRDFGPFQFFAGLIPHHILEPFVDNNVIAVVVVSVLLGFGMKSLKELPQYRAGIDNLQLLVGTSLGLISWVLKKVIFFVPVMIFGVVAQMVGTTGFGLFSTLGTFVGWISAGLAIHCFVYYSVVLLIIKKSPLLFFKQAGEALVTALGTSSSLATLPVTLRTLDEKMHVSPESSNLAACVGTNLNHNGILLYEALATLFVAEVHGISLTLSQKVVILVTSTLTAIGIAGVPAAGMITISIVLGAVGLPTTLVPLLSSVDWMIGRLRAATNVLSDLVVANLLDALKSAPVALPKKVALVAKDGLK